MRLATSPMRSHSAATLVEVFIVIVIIGILAPIAVPCYPSWYNSAVGVFRSRASALTASTDTINACNLANGCAEPGLGNYPSGASRDI